MDTSDPQRLPDPWLFDSEALLRELDRCRETVLQIPITNPNATHFGIQLAVNAIYNLTENLRYLLHLHREQQRSIRKQHEQSLTQALFSTTHRAAQHRTPSHAGAAQWQNTQQHRQPYSLPTREIREAPACFLRSFIPGRLSEPPRAARKVACRSEVDRRIFRQSAS
jgi:hypothetical protein